MPVVHVSNGISWSATKEVKTAFTPTVLPVYLEFMYEAMENQGDTT